MKLLRYFQLRLFSKGIRDLGIVSIVDLLSRRNTCVLLRSGAVSRQTAWWQDDKFPVHDRLLVPGQTHVLNREEMQTTALPFLFHPLTVPSSSWLRSCISKCFADHYPFSLPHCIDYKVLALWNSCSVEHQYCFRRPDAASLLQLSGSDCIVRQPPLHQLWKRVCIVSCLQEH